MTCFRMYQNYGGKYLRNTKSPINQSHGQDIHHWATNALSSDLMCLLFQVLLFLSHFVVVDTATIKFQHQRAKKTFFNHFFLLFCANQVKPWRPSWSGGAAQDGTGAWRHPHLSTNRIAEKAATQKNATREYAERRLRRLRAIFWAVNDVAKRR